MNVLGFCVDSTSAGQVLLVSPCVGLGGPTELLFSPMDLPLHL